MHRLFVEGLDGNHRASISELSPGRRALALSRIARWLNVPVILPGREAGEVLPSFDPPTREELFLR